MLPSSLLSSFLYKYNMSIPSLVSKALCTDIDLLILSSIFLASTFVYFKKGPEYLIRGIAEILFTCWDFCDRTKFRAYFPSLWGFLFLFFLSYISLPVLHSISGIATFMNSVRIGWSLCFTSSKSFSSGILSVILERIRGLKHILDFFSFMYGLESLSHSYWFGVS